MILTEAWGPRSSKATSEKLHDTKRMNQKNEAASMQIHSSTASFAFYPMHIPSSSLKESVTAIKPAHPQSQLPVLIDKTPVCDPIFGYFGKL